MWNAIFMECHTGWTKNVGEMEFFHIRVSLAGKQRGHVLCCKDWITMPVKWNFLGVVNQDWIKNAAGMEFCLGC